MAERVPWLIATRPSAVNTKIWVREVGRPTTRVKATSAMHHSATQRYRLSGAADDSSIEPGISVGSKPGFVSDPSRMLMNHPV